MGRLEKALERMKQQEMPPQQRAPKPAPEKHIHQLETSDSTDTMIAEPIKTPASVFKLDRSHLLANRILTEESDPAVVTSYKMLRTRLLQRMKSNGWQSLAVTSATPADGKTMTAINLAISLAGDVNHNVCLVDLDLRHSSVSRCLGLNAEKGISDCLRRGLPLTDALIRPDIDRLVVLPNAQIETHSSELLSSPEMHQMAQKWVLDDPGRIIIYDMPPLLSADDMLAFAPFIDAVLFVASERRTKRTDVMKTRELLENINVIGTVLNCSDEKTAAYY